METGTINDVLYSANWRRAGYSRMFRLTLPTMSTSLCWFAAMKTKFDVHVAAEL